MSRIFTVVGLTLILPLFLLNLVSFIFVNSYGDKLKISYAIGTDFAFNMLTMMTGYYLFFKQSSILAPFVPSGEIELTEYGKKTKTINVVNTNIITRVKMLSGVMMLAFMVISIAYIGVYLSVLHTCPGGACVNYPISCAELELFVRYNIFYRIFIAVVYFVNTYFISAKFSVRSDKVFLGVRV